MPELLTTTGAAESHIKEEQEPVAHTMPSVPPQALDALPTEQPEPRYLLDLLHVAKKLDDLNDRVAHLIEIQQMVYADMLKSRTFVDTPVYISKSVEYTVDYLERKLLYVYAPVSLTLQLATGANLIISANTWTSVSLPRGTKLTAPYIPDTSPAYMIVRATDTAL